MSEDNKNTGTENTETILELQEKLNSLELHLQGVETEMRFKH
jgi:hypothetical protein